MSGHCAFPETDNPERSHARCPGYSRANPKKEFQPCPCPCHYGEEFDCECGGLLREAPLWPNEEEEPGEMVYTHVDPRSGRATGEECP